MKIFSNVAKFLSDTGKLITRTKESTLRFFRKNSMQGIPSLFSGFDRSHEGTVDESVLIEQSEEGKIERYIRAEGNRATRTEWFHRHGQKGCRNT